MEDETRRSCDIYILMGQLKGLLKLGLITKKEYLRVADMVVTLYGQDLGNA